MKYFYRIRKGPEFRNISSQRIEGKSIKRNWTLVDKRLDISKFEYCIEERIEETALKNKSDYIEYAIHLGFTANELEGKTKNELKKLIELEETIDE